MSHRGRIRDGSQESAILRHLQTGAELDPLQALAMFGCNRLAARIHCLRNDKAAIQDRIERRGRKWWKVYFMAIPTG